MKLLVLFNLIVGITIVRCDINMGNPRGSNNRCDEASRGRRNANRLFDSQNNDRGGHNVGSFPGKMYYYAGSKLEIQWANQHSCNDENNNCNVVIQYMCDENLRDGTNTDEAPTECDGDCDTNPEYGHHESLTYYEQCASRERNKGLFVANRAGRMGDSAQSTRQNNNGNRHGFECPEERDYYPYFGPTPWKDIAILTSDTSKCALYHAESQNEKSKWACSLPDEYWESVKGQLLEDDEAPEITLYNDQASCEQVQVTLEDGTVYNAEWREFPSHGIAAPECLEAPWSIDNHQGNTYGGELLSYIWTIPDINEEHCTLRMRYNISTNDFKYWDTDHTKNLDRANGNLGPEEIYNYLTFNGETSPRSNKKLEATRRHYFLRDNPIVDVFDLRTRANKFKLRVALNTAQYGRTFQDRSHSFAIKQRPASLTNANIYNLNVRGKRGNLAQVYPGFEYDFVPNILNVDVGDHVHIQWTGSDNNPGNNAGQGARRTDRHNLVQLGLRPYAEGDTGTKLTLGVNYPRDIGDNFLWGETENRMKELAFGGYCKPGETLNDADAYFDFGAAKMSEAGVYHYFCTRNNNFSNRSQKGTIVVN
uniref:protein DD3-3-like n=1 Tax=Styela clava TaxID=7725 RepID=UPI00193959F5|nr:protein DD3-3-like [Styela clava]